MHFLIRWASRAGLLTLLTAMIATLMLLPWYALLAAVVLLVVGGMHFFLWARLFRDPAWPSPWPRLGGALLTALLDWANGERIGFSHLVSLGEHADVDFGDMLDYLASDARTRAILLYIESVEAPRKFMSAARAAARNKPVIVIDRKSVV